MRLWIEVSVVVITITLWTLWVFFRQKSNNKLTPISLDLPEPEVVPENDEGQLESPQSNREIISISLLANPNQIFGGYDLLQTLLTNNFRFGKYNIFHYYELDTIQFSLASAMKPGTFDIDNMNSYSTSGVSFFMELNDDPHCETNFEKMLQIANMIAKDLGGYLVNKEREALTDSKVHEYRKTIRSHLREQINEPA